MKPRTVNISSINFKYSFINENIKYFVEISDNSDSEVH